MNKLLPATIVAGLLASATLAAPALAQSPANPPTTQPTAPSAAPSGKSKIVQQKSPLFGTRQCIRDTGSHIPPPKGQCLPVAGTSYSQRDIQRTGANTIGQALQMLDPSVTVHGR